jgi:hypothetical protein
LICTAFATLDGAALQGQSEQLSDVTTRLHKALTKLELCQGQLEKKQREVKELQEAAKVRNTRRLAAADWQVLAAHTSLHSMAPLNAVKCWHLPAGLINLLRVSVIMRVCPLLQLSATAILLLHWLQVCERLLGEARLLAKSLTADVERLTKEKKDQADRAEAKQVGAPQQQCATWGVRAPPVAC